MKKGPRDFSLGNNVKCTISNDAAIYAIWSISYKGCGLSGNRDGEIISWDKIKPIPITPEYLISVGFTNEIEEELPEDAEFLYFFKDNIDVELIPSLLGGYKVEGITLYEDEVEEDGQLVSKGKYEIKSDIQYVHQLQNLYKIITGDKIF